MQRSVNKKETVKTADGGKYEQQANECRPLENAKKNTDTRNTARGKTRNKKLDAGREKSWIKKQMDLNSREVVEKLK